MTNGKLDGYRLEWLTSFLAVVDFGGFAVAAENTYRAQSRISSHVAELEKHLGAVLFDRRERPVRLTEAGVARDGRAEMLSQRLQRRRSP